MLNNSIKRSERLQKQLDDDIARHKKHVEQQRYYIQQAKARAERAKESERQRKEREKQMRKPMTLEEIRALAEEAKALLK